MAEQALLPTLGWPALVPGPVFLCFEIEGKPGHKARHRSRIVFPKKGKAFIHNYPDPDTEAYENLIREYAGLLMNQKHAQPTERAVCLLVHSFREIPRSWPEAQKARALADNVRPTSRPDWDNYGKITDALNEVVWRDDAQVVDGRVIKAYSDRPALRVEIREMVEP